MGGREGREGKGFILEVCASFLVRCQQGCEVGSLSVVVKRPVRWISLLIVEDLLYGEPKSAKIEISAVIHFVRHGEAKMSKWRMSSTMEKERMWALN